MATIANLAVSLTARVGPMLKGFNTAMKKIKRFSTDVARHTRMIAQYGVALLSVGAGALAFFIKQQFSSIDATAKLARTMGLSTEQLVGYQHAIQIAGGNQEGFNKAVVRMNRSIADAQAGLSTIVREFDRVNVDVKELAGLSTDERIKLLADRYLSIGDAAGRASFLMNIFGRQGIAIGNLFEQGSRGIEQAQKKAEELGLTFSNLDAAQVEAANDAFTRMRGALSAVAKTLAIRLAPFVQAVAERITAMAQAGTQGGASINHVFDSVVKRVARLADFIELGKAAWFGFQSVVLRGGSLIISLFAMIANAIQNVANLIPGINLTIGDNLTQVVGDFADASTDAFNKSAQALQNFTNRVNSSKIGNTFKAIEKRADQLRASTAKASIEMDDLQDDSSQPETKGSAFARAINLKRVALGGIGVGSNDKPTTMKQGQMMIQKLTEIATNTKDAQAVTS